MYLRVYLPVLSQVAYSVMGNSNCRLNVVHKPSDDSEDLVLLSSDTVV
jgi:hypothetical protein